MNPLCDDLPEFTSLNGRKFYFVKMQGPNYLHVWEDVGGDRFHDHRVLQRLIPVQQIEVEVLKKLNVWDGLAERLKSEVAKITEKDQGCIDVLEANARAARRVIHATMPKEIACIQCGKKLNIAPCLLLKRIEKITADKGTEYTVADYVAGYKCQRCEPTPKGRKPNPRASTLPKELTCKCGKTVKTNPTQLIAAATKKGISPEEYASAYVCRTCSGNWGRKANPAYANLPKELKCTKCEVAKPCAPSSIAQRAKSKGISPEEFLKGYVCGNCGGPRRGRPSTKKST
jgi:hypothetical protein